MAFVLIGCQEKKLSPEEIEAKAIEKAIATADIQKESDTNAARSTLIDALALYPNNTNALEAMAMLEAQDNKPAAAARFFALLTEKNPNEDAYLRYAADQFSKAGMFSEAITYYTRFLVHETEDVFTWKALGNAYVLNNEPKRALATYQNALSMSPQDTESLIACLTLALELKDAALAAVYLQVLSLQPDTLSLTWAQFDLAMLKKDYSAASTLLPKLASEAPQALASRGAAIALITDWEAKKEAEALAKAERLLTLQKLEEEKALAQAAALAAFALEAEITKAANEANPPKPTAAQIVQEAQAKAYQGELAEASKLYWQALALEPNTANYWAELSQVALKNGELEQSEIAALEAVRLDSQNVLQTLNLLDILQRSAPPERLLEELVLAKEHFPNSIEITYDLAKGYEILGKNPRNARILYEEYLRLAPENHPRREEVNRALRKLAD